MASVFSESSFDLYEELWRACAGPLLLLPRAGERVCYFPQGHHEQVAASSNWNLNEMLPSNFNLPSKILCRVINTELLGDGETDEVYAQITLLPECDQTDVAEPGPQWPDLPKPIFKSFYKVLTATDISSKLHVRQQDAHDCFPPLDMTRESPSQELVAKDIHGITWHFKHVFGGNPKRHLLSTGWKRFVTAKRLVCGDSVIFLRGGNGELRVGIRNVFSQSRYVPHCYSSSGKRTDSLAEVLAASGYALSTQTLFIVFYHPSVGSSPFIVGVNRYIECAKNQWSIGLKFSMRFEGEGHLERRCTGSIVEVGDVSTCWTDSQWKCLKVKWDEPEPINRPERVSPWEIDPVDLNKEESYVQRNVRLAKRNQAKKTRQPTHHSSAREGNMMDMPIYPNEQNWCFQVATQRSQQQQVQNVGQIQWSGLAPSNMPIMDPPLSSQQYWIQNVGQPNWPSVQTLAPMCQHSWIANDPQSSYQHQAHNMNYGEQQTWPQMYLSQQQSNIPMSPLLSNEDNWLQQTLDQCNLQIPGHDEPVQLDELGQIFGSSENSLNTIVCNQFPTESPPIHFSDLQGEPVMEPPSRVSVNSEESVQGKTRKRKASSAGDAESGNGKEPGFDDRQVKSRIEPSQCGMVSNSNGTHYSSVSEGEPSTGKCNQDSPPAEGTENASGRPLIYRAWDWIFGFLLHQLKNYVAK